MNSQKSGYLQTGNTKEVFKKFFEEAIPELNISVNNENETLNIDTLKTEKNSSLYINPTKEAFNTKAILKKYIPSNDVIFNYHLKNILKSDIENISRFNPLFISYSSSIQPPSIKEKQKTIEQKDEYIDFSNKLLNIIKKEDFEYGFETDSDRFIKTMFQKDADKTKNFLNKVYIDYYSDKAILIAVLRIVSRFEYHEIEPQGQTMMLGVLSHKDEEIIETVVRSFETWNNQESIKYLKEIQLSDEWLESYKNSVIDDIEKFYGITN
ncbi:hypothetical protein [Myroides odoratimimus]|uniref:Uncharacterized protein n=1 Tax=Myroides odoratimimus CIP 101113 TaxID=883154 RepID=A0AAV3F7A0_9FLAO|nr:hypothetical protein [Myroides odoratimimus]EHO14687.1 hypothetical protein HMPREF9715_00572 [Myroides odoratimimus CIP 101113]